MRLFRHHEGLEPRFRGMVAALGNFDGFHRGHHVVIGEAGRLARAIGTGLAVVTTEPHPVSFFARDAEPFRLTPFRERTRLLESFGVDLSLVLPFDKELAATPAQEFVAQILLGGLGILHVVVGYDYRFGQGRGPFVRRGISRQSVPEQPLCQFTARPFKPGQRPFGSGRNRIGQPLPVGQLNGFQSGQAFRSHGDNLIAIGTARPVQASSTG